jgi:EAL domain-containing protein (putative c-di-GMP-specific phosphodiesterase class I)
LTFISVAETNGAILPIGDWVLETACRQLLQWQRDGLHGITLSVNVSGCQLRDPGYAERVHQTLTRTGVSALLIELEITETQALQTQSEGAQTLLSLRELGVKLAIDDFGVGYSSLARLHTLPVDRFKIDQSFVRDLANSPKAQAISQCFISMGLAMGMEVVAEGVETLVQHQLLVDQGCSLIQGYLTGRPMTASALLTFFGTSSPPRPAETLT